ncbi:MAG TPA: twin-arginine translocase TatA/TatE family subunit [Pyrinomonadaceae bacterium]|jgi:sec-independent protein translocase protein TatB|nr:twin-arginine translocase TatA/TatE family subunit [Pyrinomonadaceae bacterium]
MMLAFILEGLGTTELLVILVVALILFGPRKLPQLSRSLGKSLGEFKRASEDFKKTWEKEVALEEREKEGQIERAMLPPEDNSILSNTVERNRAVLAAADTAGVQESGAADSSLNAQGTEVSRKPSDESDGVETFNTSTSSPTHPAPPASKRDWL